MVCRVPDDVMRNVWKMPLWHPNICSTDQPTPRRNIIRYLSLRRYNLQYSMVLLASIEGPDQSVLRLIRVFVARPPAYSCLSWLLAHDFYFVALVRNMRVDWSGPSLSAHIWLKGALGILRMISILLHCSESDSDGKSLLLLIEGSDVWKMDIIQLRKLLYRAATASVYSTHEVAWFHDIKEVNNLYCRKAGRVTYYFRWTDNES